MPRHKEADINQLTYEKNLSDWMKALAGYYVVIIDGDLVDFDTDEKALIDRSSQFSLNAKVLIKSIPDTKPGEE